MCGRYTLSSDVDAIARMLAELGGPTQDVPPISPRYNIAPTQRAWALTGSEFLEPRAQHGGPTIVPMAFGFRPSFMSHGVINARAETVQDKPMFRRALASRRCLVLASGFYEWEKLGDGSKKPHHFTLQSGAPFVFAGLYRATEPKDVDFGHVDHEFVIVTTEANGCVGAIHGRMPVILPGENAGLWLSAKTPTEVAAHLLAPFPAREMLDTPVSSRVNRATVDDAECIAPSP